ncbi:MAG: YidC/Oxa1 family membrane protein insertase [Lachnospiraceae bacterium]|nr:YidC/Oxa1 family membrane protein insertase [Lachnospiraceae bacterium]
MYYLLLSAADTAAKSTKFFYEDWIIIKPFIWLFSQCMNGIMFVLDKVGIYNIALCIVLFTILTKMLLLPLTVKQQKSMRIQTIMNPEIQALQKKYAGKTDTLSRQKMMEEQQAIQQKYGVSMFGGCLPTLIQMPILFALYPVIYRMEEYVKYLGTLESKLSSEQYTRMWQLFDLNLKNSPKSAEGFPFAWPVLLPILVAAAQFLQTKLMTSRQQNQHQSDNPMGNSMKVMNIVMPLMIGFMAISFPAFLGLYWLVQSLVMLVQQILINKSLDKKTTEELIKENIEKANKKRARRGQPPISDKASISTRNLDRLNARAEDTQFQEEKEAKMKAATEYYQSRTAAPGSLAAKANMVRDYNERTKK